MTRVLILADVQNLYYTTRQAFGRRFNYNAFWAQIQQRADIHQAFAYAIDRGDQKQREFQNILRAIGFEVKLKPYIQRSDGSAKGDWDVGIAVDALEHCQEVDEVVLMSGDGDFDILARALRNKGKRVTVYGVEALTADSLVNAADQYHPIKGSLLL